MKSRGFNSVHIVNDSTIKKSSTDVKKIQAEYDWLTSSITADYNKPFTFGLIYDNCYASYQMTYIHGRTLSDIYINELIPVERFLKIIEYIILKLKSASISNLPYGISDNDKTHLVSLSKDLYTAKTLARLEQYDPSILSSKFTLNDIILPSIKNIITSCEVSVSESDLRVIHGDMCFSNIILDDINSDDFDTHLYFIDPRGLYRTSNGVLNSCIGDYKYDLGKLGHSIIGDYDLIKNDLISATKQNNNYTFYLESTSYKNTIKEYYWELVGKENKDLYYNIMINLFLSMVPLHYDNRFHQHTMIANALRLYLEKDRLTTNTI